MKTNINFNNFFKVGLLALFLFSSNIANVKAADAQVPAFCNPLPDDAEQLAICVEAIGTAPGSIYNPTIGPVTGPGSGIHGLSSAYNPEADNILLVTTAGNSDGIIGQFYNAQTLAGQGAKFRVDQSPAYAGSPQIIFNPEAKNYLVIWIDGRQGNNSGMIYGRFVNADGTFVGSDFAIHREFSVLPNIDFSYDSKNKQYVLVYGNSNTMFLRKVSSTGTVSAYQDLDREDSAYEGQVSVTYNPDRNEYWYAYVRGVGGDGTAQEDDRIMFSRVDASTMLKVGEPVQLSTTRLGANAFAAPKIGYSTANKAALVAWQERGRTPGMASEVYGRTIHNDLSLSNEFPILAGINNTSSDFYGAPSNVTYNSKTNSFGIAAQDNNGNITFVEILSNGTIIDTYVAIAKTSESGTFGPNVSASGKNGFNVGASSGNTATSLSRALSNGSNMPSQPVVPYQRKLDDLSSSDLSKTISQIYLFSLGVAAALALVMTVFGGYLVMTARGNGSQAAKGKDYLNTAIIGLLILFAAYLILNTINSDLVNFNIPSLKLLN